MAPSLEGDRTRHSAGCNPVQSENRAAIGLLPENPTSIGTDTGPYTDGRAGRQRVEAAINDLAKFPNSGFVIMPDIFTAAKTQRDLIISLAARLRIPAVYAFTFFVKDGGLISYGADNDDLLRRAADYVDRILKGKKPQDLPVQLPTKFELAINTKTAAALGVNFRRLSSPLPTR